MKIKILLIFLLVLIISGILFVLNQTKNRGINKVSTATEKNIYSAQISSDEEIDVETTPSVSSDKKTWSFQITLTTHSGSLDEDLVELTTLESNDGEMLKPLNWEGSPPGGHHREGNLIFPPFSKIPKSVTLTIQGVGDVERTFTWNVE